ncbi:MAG: hypothetical protein GY719_01170 [bacterium]|nr:hypothetical protein [bacterium]
MQRGRNILSLVLAAALAVAPALAGDDGEGSVALDGTWTMTIQGKAPPGKNFASLKFDRQGDETVVIMTGKGGELRSACEANGETLRFEHVTPGKKATIIVFDGRVQGDLMGGEVDMGKRGKSQWQAIREGEGVLDLSGTWTFFQKGLPRDYTNLTKLHFSQQGPNLVATFTTGKEETVCQGYLDGDSLGFEYSRATGDGQTVGANYVGGVSGDMMRGEVDMGEGGKSTWQATRDDG